MMCFLQVCPLALTPLTPLHVGCGEDFEPTNYVIEDGILFHFDPGQVPMGPAERKALRDAVAAPAEESIRQVQHFFHARRAAYAAVSHRAVMVAPGVAAQYDARVGRVAQREEGGRRVVNILEIERTAYHPHTGVPYLPGSSLKGAMRTAWISELNKGRPAEQAEKAADMERRLLEGSFSADPFRLVRLADAHGPHVRSRVLFSTNHKKREVLDKEGKPITAQGPAVRRECVDAGQYRALGCEIRFDSLGGLESETKTPKSQRRIAGWEALAQACNAFYIRRMTEELDVLDRRRLVAPDWLAAMQSLLAALRPRLEAGRAMLLRVGRHSGAESVTIEGARSIRIMKKRGERPTDGAKEATTLWMAAQHESARSEMAPFGWLLVEPADTPDFPELRKWCESQTPADAAQIDQRLRNIRATAAAERAEKERLEHERLEAEARNRRAAEQEQARLAALSAEGQQVERLRARLGRHEGRKQPVGGVLFEEVRKLLKLASEGGWTAEDKRALADLVEGLGFEKIDFGGKTKEIKRAIAALRGAQ